MVHTKMYTTNFIYNIVWKHSNVDGICSVQSCLSIWGPGLNRHTSFEDERPESNSTYEPWGPGLLQASKRQAHVRPAGPTVQQEHYWELQARDKGLWGMKTRAPARTEGRSHSKGHRPKHRNMIEGGKPECGSCYSYTKNYVWNHWKNAILCTISKNCNYKYSRNNKEREKDIVFANQIAFAKQQISSIKIVKRKGALRNSPTDTTRCYRQWKRPLCPRSLNN